MQPHTLFSAASFGRILVLGIMAAALSACNISDRILAIGDEPALSAIQNPVKQKDYKPVSLPMPRPKAVIREANSLWRPGARAFFKDQRAARIGDILTVTVSIADSAKVNNTTTRTRKNAEDSDLTNFLGYENKLAKVLPQSVDPSSLVSLGSTSESTGTGKVDRSETINLEVAALVTQILPNGNLVISGRQEVRINYEVRELLISGVVRPEDITADNRIKHSQIAEARIAYGGRGQLSDVQQPRYGQQLFDVIFPF